MPNSVPHFEMKVNAESKVIDVYIYDYIVADDFFGGVSAKTVREDLNTDEAREAETMNLYINSGGGDVFEGVAIYNVLLRHDSRKNVFIDGMAASMASVLAMIGDEITIAENAAIMVHNPWGVAIGDSETMRKYADELDRVRDSLIKTYEARTGKTAEELREMLDDETWMYGQEAVDMGFADKIAPAKRMAACVMIDNTRGVPAKSKAATGGRKDNQMADSPKVEAATHEQIKAACPGCDAQFILDQLEASATLDAARDAYTNTLAAQVQNLTEELDKAKSEHAEQVKSMQAKNDEAANKSAEEIKDLQKQLADVKAGVTPEESPEAPKTPDKPKGFKAAVRISGHSQ